MPYNFSPLFQFVAAELDRYLKDSARPTGYAGIASPAQLSNDPDFSDPHARNRVSLALLSILPEHEGVREYLVLVFAAFKSYDHALARLSRAQEFFRERPILTAENSNGAFPAELTERIDFAQVFPDAEEQRNWWAMHGGRSLPCVFLRMRVVPNLG